MIAAVPGARAAPVCAMPAESADLTLHADRLDPDAVGHGQHKSLDLLKSEGPVQRDARQGRAEIHPFEAFGAGRVPAGLKNRPAQSAPGPVTAHKHRPDVRGLGGGMQKTIIVLVAAVTHVEPAPAAPASARNDLPPATKTKYVPSATSKGSTCAMCTAALAVCRSS